MHLFLLCPYVFKKNKCLFIDHKSQKVCKHTAAMVLGLLLSFLNYPNLYLKNAQNRKLVFQITHETVYISPESLSFLLPKLLQN